ncbi:MAG: aldo/keto reductase [Phycisphaerales bacterium]
MELRTLGRTGIAVSALGLGTVKLGRTQGLKYPRPFELPSDELARGLLRTAQDSGVNYIDTAPAYGTAEERLGTLLAGERDRWVISTKFGETFEAGFSTFDFSPAAMRASLERSLRRLRTSYIDLLLVHSDGVIESALPDDLVAAMGLAREQGLVRAIGMSSKTPAGGLAALGWADVLMLTLNPGARADEPVIAAAAAAGLGVVVKKALLSGHVGGGGPTAADCLGLALGTPGVSSVVVGTASAENLQTNARLVDEILSAKPPGR